MCCACDGSCNHVGPHSFCPAHGGQPAASPSVVTSTSNVMLLSAPMEDATVLRRAAGILRSRSKKKQGIWLNALCKVLTGTADAIESEAWRT